VKVLQNAALIVPGLRGGGQSQ